MSSKSRNHRSCFPWTAGHRDDGHSPGSSSLIYGMIRVERRSYVFFAPDNYTALTRKDENMTENEKAFGFYAYNLSLISTGLSSQEATISARQSFDEASMVNTVQTKLSNEPEYGKMITSSNPVPYYDPLMELLVTDPSQDPTTARNIRVRHVLTRAVIENRIEPEEVLLHDRLFKEGSRADLDALWTRADPNMTLTNRLKAMYLERQKTKIPLRGKKQK